MGILEWIRKGLELSTIAGSKKYRERMLTGKDIFTGDSNYRVNIEARIKNLETKVEPIENSQTVLYKIEELEGRLKNGDISNKEKVIISEHLTTLHKKYEELLNEEKNTRSYNSDYLR